MIEWDQLPPVYKTRYETLMANWEVKHRKDTVEELRFFREMRKRLQEVEALSGEDKGSTDVDDIIGTLIERLYQ